MKLTFVDADVLISAAKGTEDFSSTALSILDDPERTFVSSDFVKLEVLPMVAFFGYVETLKVYEAFFANVSEWVPSSPELSRRAVEIACEYGLGAVDALHVAAAEAAEAELVTAERPTKPMLRVASVKVTSIRDARISGGG